MRGTAPGGAGNGFRRHSLRRAVKRSFCASSRMSGGMRRTVLPWHTLTRTPLSRQCFCTAVAASLDSISIPMIRPRPRTSFTLGLWIAFRSFIQRAPRSREFSTSLSFFMMSRTAQPEAVTRGFPPNVVPWDPGVITLEISSVDVTAPMGAPPPRAFAMVIMSGTTP